MTRESKTYKYVSTKEYHDAFPCAYRQWRASDKPDGAPGCNKIHGYSFSMKFYFGTDDLDVRNWAADYGGLRDLKKTLEGQFDHTLLVSADDPHLDWYKEAESRGIAKLTILPRLGCESLADMLYKYINGVYIPDMWGSGEAERLWCFRVEVRETQSNMAYREGHRSWNEDLFSDI
jgi:6-pyruvoyltetrahydropterin/6-carboxytetrahydropterin synthase